MHSHHLSLLACPQCHKNLEFLPAQPLDRTLNGELKCQGCTAVYPIRGGVPRFVAASNYSDSFGFQWNLHAKTQYDSFTGINVSQDRLFKETRWPKNLAGQCVLEVGSGSGRFTEQIAATGATLVSLDYSQAVEANVQSNGTRPNVLIVQASIYEMPIPRASFDKVICIGVLQHTPDVEKSFQALVNALKPGGELVIDVYRWRLVNWLWPRYWLRALTKRLPAPFVYQLCQTYVERVWPLTKLIHKLPMGRKINRFFLVPDFRDVYPLPEDLLRQWAILDTFDNLTPAYDQPQSLKTVRRWFETSGLENVDVHLGYNGIEGRARKPRENSP